MLKDLINKTHKFRAWDTKDGRYCYFTLEELMERAQAPLETWKFVWPISRYEIERGTGIVDKDGREIYEGDIVEHTYSGIGGKSTHTQTVFWDKKCWNMGWKEISHCGCVKYKASTAGTCTWKAFRECRVIGNSRENSGLVREKRV